jgi:hypothetical protein
MMALLMVPSQAMGVARSSELFLRHEQHGIRSATVGAAGRTQVKPHEVLQLTQPEHETAAKVKQQFPFYHTSDELLSEVTRLSHGCGGILTFKTEYENSTRLEVINVRRADATPVNRVFLLFGEHSRELISPESGLAFLRVLCGELTVTTPVLPTNTVVADLMKDNEFQIVLNANPYSRQKVEGGQYCLRTNPDGVDLNRNWNDHWQHQAASGFDDSNPGPKPFSEPETRILKRLVTKFKPTTFLTVHSGTRGMYMPWAYDQQHLGAYNQVPMMDILRSIDKEHCKCPFGAAGKEVGYPCPGTCLDYAYGELQTPFVFAFEIFTSPESDEELASRWQDKMQSGGEELLQSGSHLGHTHFRDFFKEYASDFVETGTKKGIGVDDLFGSESEMSDIRDSCFAMFNPRTEDDYNKTVTNWAAVYLEMSVLVAQKLHAA